MNPIIDPSFIYLLQLIEGLHIFAICAMPFSLVYLLIMFYPPVLFFIEKNPFKAFLITMKDLFLS